MRTSIIYEDDGETLLRCDIKRRTDQAIMLTGTQGQSVWLPISQIEIIEDETTFEGNESEILVSSWLIVKHNLV